jgi:hypothetical protein
MGTTTAGVVPTTTLNVQLDVRGVDAVRTAAELSEMSGELRKLTAQFRV